MSYTSSCPFKRATKAKTLFAFYNHKTALDFATDIRTKIVRAHAITISCFLDDSSHYSVEFRSEDLYEKDATLVLKLAKKYKAIGNY